MGQLRIRRIKREWDEALKTVRLVLLLAKLDEMIDAIFNRLDVPVKHRRIRFQSRGVKFSLQLEPALGIAFVSADHRARRLAKDLRAATRTRIQARFDEFLNDLFV